MSDRERKTNHGKLKALVVFGTHGNQGFATVARVKDVFRLQEADRFANENMCNVFGFLAQDYVAAGRLCKLPLLGEEATLDDEFHSFPVSGFKGLWNGEACVYDLIKLPPKAM